jgi:hypothetical protein
VIISHRHQFIFFAVPKTATHTIRTALRRHLGDGDWEQQQLFGQQSIPIPDIARIGHGHISARRIRSHIEDATWHNYFKFGFVRNPFDRFVSTCFFLHRNNPAFSEDPLPHMKQALKNRSFRQRVLVRPQALQLVDDNDELALDYIGRYESLQSSYDEICEHIGIESVALGHENASKRGSCVDYFDGELRQAIMSFYADDLRLFDYQFPVS